MPPITHISSKGGAATFRPLTSGASHGGSGPPAPPVRDEAATPDPKRPSRLICPAPPPAPVYVCFDADPGGPRIAGIASHESSAVLLHGPRGLSFSPPCIILTPCTLFRWPGSFSIPLAPDMPPPPLHTHKQEPAHHLLLPCLCGPFYIKISLMCSRLHRAHKQCGADVPGPAPLSVCGCFFFGILTSYRECNMRMAIDRRHDALSLF